NDLAMRPIETAPAHLEAQARRSETTPRLTVSVPPASRKRAVRGSGVRTRSSPRVVRPVWRSGVENTTFRPGRSAALRTDSGGGSRTVSGCPGATEKSACASRTAPSGTERTAAADASGDDAVPAPRRSRDLPWPPALAADALASPALAELALAADAFAALPP